MANSKYEYVRSFEQPDAMLPNTWIVVRIDGRGFSKLTAKYNFAKPNDRRALDLMNAAAEAVMKELPDLVLAYGNSDEFSFVFHKDCVLFERRASKLTTTIVSTFSSYYTFLWPTYFPDSLLTPPLPSFDGRAVCYPSDQNLRDYMSWRQVDCHINNLYNTTFWALVQQGGIEARAAEQELSGTVSSNKNEILFSRFGINYNNEPEIFKKGSVLYRDFFPTSIQSSQAPLKAIEMPPPLSHPQPRRSLTRPMSQPLERTIPDFLPDSPLSADLTPRGPTFLSTSTTPSPPPSPPLMSMPAVPFPQTFLPVSAPSANSNSSSVTTASTKQHLPQLTPLPLPPPTLKPSTKPPPSLSPPNPTTHTNTSPFPSPNPMATITIPDRTTSTANSSKHASHSHSASASLTSSFHPLATATASSSRPSLKHRSPSLSILDQPPIIPLRISSIPLNNNPRKLSLPSQKSSNTLKTDEKENAHLGPSKPTRSSPPLQIMKELPSPPLELNDEAKGRAMYERSGPATAPAIASSWKNPDWDAAMGFSRDRAPQAVLDPLHSNPVFASTSPPSRPPRLNPQRRSHSHSRLHSAPPTTLSAFPPSSSTTTTTSYSVSVTAPGPSKTKANSSRAKSRIAEEGGWAAGTKSWAGDVKGMSKSAKEKDRKKRSKAKIVIEHVDVIKDEFWERRPWILSGRAG